MTLLETLGIDLPIIQSPMAGVSSPAMAAAVSNAVALGSIGVGATDAEGARRMIADVRARAGRSLNVNVCDDYRGVSLVGICCLAADASSPVRPTHGNSFAGDFRLVALLRATGACDTDLTVGIARVHPLSAINRDCGTHENAEHVSGERTQ